MRRRSRGALQPALSMSNVRLLLDVSLARSLALFSVARACDLSSSFLAVRRRSARRSDRWLCASSSANLHVETEGRRAFPAFESSNPRLRRARTITSALTKRADREPWRMVKSDLKSAALLPPCPSPSPRDWGDQAESRTSLSSFAPRESRKPYVMSVSFRAKWKDGDRRVWHTKIRFFLDIFCTRSEDHAESSSRTD